MSKLNRRTLVRGVAVFVLLPLLVGGLMYAKMVGMIHDYMEDQAAAQARVLTQLAERRLTVRLTELEQVAGYLKDGAVPEGDMGGVAAELLQNPSRLTLGVLRLDGSAVTGGGLTLADHPAVLSAFRGKSAVRYREGEGLLFTAPVYHNGNVRYVLYEFFDTQALFADFDTAAFGGQARLMLADRGQEIAVAITQDGMGEDDPYFQTGAARQAISTLAERMNTDTTACALVPGGGERDFLFASIIGSTGLYLVGVVPHRAVAGNLGRVSVMAALVFALLILLLAVGLLRVVSADARARESDELRRAFRMAEQANESKSKFLSSMTHELRTPINTILGMDEMILRETQEAVTRERAMDVKSASQILLGLINDVLDFSKIESGKLNILPEEYDLTAVIRDLVLLSENRARAKSLDFRLEIDPELPVGLYGDDIRIRQVLTNLLTNAVKYTREGVVTLRMSGTREGEDGLTLRCEVADTGIGIRPEDVEKLKRLAPFTRVDEERNRQVEGSGLGLPIIINLLRLMGSELEIDSVYGQGSVFSFDLEQRVVDFQAIGDARKRLADDVKQYEYRARCRAPRARVLVVDDNAMNRKIFVSLLGPTKIRVDAASGGAKCLELTRRERYDVIFMDHLMPEMDGVETLRRLREQDGPNRDAPVVALTANAVSGAREKYLAAGFDAFLAKPIVPEKLEALLAELLPRELLEQPPEDAPPNEPEPLPEIEGVDWDYALRHLGDGALALSSLKEFARTIGTEREDLRALAERADAPEGLADYRIRVHALKSTAAMVGLLSVSELARLLEDAARSGDREKLRTLNPVLLESLDQTRERLEAALGRGEEKAGPMTDRPELLALLEMLRGALEEMDIAAADEAMKRLDRYTYGPEMQGDMDELSGLVAALRFEQAQELASRLLDRAVSAPVPDEKAP